VLVEAAADVGLWGGPVVAAAIRERVRRARLVRRRSEAKVQPRALAPFIMPHAFRFAAQSVARAVSTGRGGGARGG